MNDKEFNEEVSQDDKINLSGEQYVVWKRVAFGDGDSQNQHAITMNATIGSKKGAIFAHSDYTLVVAQFDGDKGKEPGPAHEAVQNLMKAYKEAGY